MTDRLPPLTALRAFEAAARHMSFAKAAEELNVTPAALSFQIKSLEEHLGQPLFIRLNRAVELTEAGRALSPGASEAFETLTSAWRTARRTGDDHHLTVTSGPGFTSFWLAPRLFSFARSHPDIQLRLSATLKVLDFSRDGIDVAIRFGAGSDEGNYTRPLCRDWVTPMVSPALAERLKTPEDLARLTLLIDETTERVDSSISWRAWKAAAGLGTEEQPSVSFNTPDLAVGAAISGAGVLLGRFSLTDQAVRDGRLVMPFDLTIRSEFQYRIVCPLGTETRPNISAFLDWLDAEAAGMADIEQGRRFVSAEGIAV